MADVAFSCQCGEVCGTLHDMTPRAGGQVQCHCDDCRRAIVWLGQPDPGPDGVRYFQTVPERVSFTQGQDRLAAYLWKHKRLMRWYATCCNTPMFNTLDSPKWAFASIMVTTMDDPSPIGPVTAHAFVPKSNGKKGHTNVVGFFGGFVLRTLGQRLSGKWRNTPFFDDNGQPIAKVQRLTSEDRAKATL